jgi:hypothetical protein
MRGVKTRCACRDKYTETSLMPRRAAASYTEMLELMEETHLTLIRVVRVPRMPPVARDLLLGLIEQHAAIIVRDNGRGRRSPPSAARVEALVSQRIS